MTSLGDTASPINMSPTSTDLPGEAERMSRPRRFGNRVSNPLSQAAFAAEGTGPGRLTAAIVQCSDAELAVNYSADVAGRYSLAIRCRSTGEVCGRNAACLVLQCCRLP